MFSMYFFKLHIIFKSLNFNIHFTHNEEKSFTQALWCSRFSSFFWFASKQGCSTNLSLPPSATSHTKLGDNICIKDKWEQAIQISILLCPRLVLIRTSLTVLHSSFVGLKKKKSYYLWYIHEVFVFCTDNSCSLHFLINGCHESCLPTGQSCKHSTGKQSKTLRQTF